jgi:RNA polymerase sigma-70 factor (ECF subfamily)
VHREFPPAAEPDPAPDTAGTTAAEREWRVFQAARDDAEALGRLFEAHHATLIAYVFRRSGDAATTEDIVADAFLRAARARRQLTWRGVPLRGWLMRVASNELRARARRARGASVADDLPATPPAADHEALRDAIAGLPSELAEAITLHHLQECPVAEVAATMGVPEGTVKSWLARGRALLRERLQRREAKEA